MLRNCRWVFVLLHGHENFRNVPAVTTVAVMILLYFTAGVATDDCPKFSEWTNERISSDGALVCAKMYSEEPCDESSTNLVDINGAADIPMTVGGIAFVHTTVS